MEIKRGRIAYYGGIANNCYVAASRISEAGLDSLFIRDREDNYAISQPLWEDCRMALTYDELGSSSSWTPHQWDERADALGWSPPPWYVDPVNIEEEAAPDWNVFGIRNLAAKYTPAPHDHFRKIIALMRSCELVFASNAHAVILAAMSGRPYIICPAGSEFLLACNLVKSKDASVQRTLNLQGRMLRTAFRKARSVMTQTSFLQHAELAGGHFDLIRHFWRVKFERVSMPYACRQRLSPYERRLRLNQFLEKLGAGPVHTKFSLFIPSRIDYRWKGQDILLRALENLEGADQFTIICAGWGADFESYRKEVGGQQHFRILSGALSKPLLYDVLGASDLVGDQFKVGHLGTAAREALSQGTPVLGWLNLHGSQNESEPPILSAATSEGVREILADIVSGRIDLEHVGKLGQDWIDKYSSPECMAAALSRHMLPAVPTRTR